jgi:DNA-directed RNA polymerase specialized sigma24 family protein
MRDDIRPSQKHENAFTCVIGNGLDEVDRQRLRHESKQKPQTTCQAPDGDQLWKLLLVVAIYQIRHNCFDDHVISSELQRAVKELQTQDCFDSNESSRELAPVYLELVLNSILEQLPPHHRMIAALRLDGCDIAQVARLSKRSMRSVERILHESRHMLASLVDERGSHELSSDRLGGDTA